MKIYLLLALGLLAFSGHAFAADKVDLKDETAQISYSLGYQIGGDFRKQQVDINAEAIIQGIQDALATSEPQLSTHEMKALLIALKQKVVAEQQRESSAFIKNFLAENLKKPGVKELPGGVQYRIVQPGSGATPKLEDTVDIHYRASRADGTLISTTYNDANTPRSYQVKKTLPALQQALLQMQPGSKWEVIIPPSNRSELSEKGNLLIYELELVSIHPLAG